MKNTEQTCKWAAIGAFIRKTLTCIFKLLDEKAGQIIDQQILT